MSSLYSKSAIPTAIAAKLQLCVPVGTRFPKIEEMNDYIQVRDVVFPTVKVTRSRNYNKNPPEATFKCPTKSCPGVCILAFQNAEPISKDNRGPVTVTRSEKCFCVKVTEISRDAMLSATYRSNSESKQHGLMYAAGRGVPVVKIQATGPVGWSGPPNRNNSDYYHLYCKVNNGDWFLLVRNAQTERDKQGNAVKGADGKNVKIFKWDYIPKLPEEIYGPAEDTKFARDRMDSKPAAIEPANDLDAPPMERDNPGLDVANQNLIPVAGPEVANRSPPTVVPDQPDEPAMDAGETPVKACGICGSSLEDSRLCKCDCECTEYICFECLQSHMWSRNTNKQKPFEDGGPFSCENKSAGLSCPYCRKTPILNYWLLDANGNVIEAIPVPFVHGWHGLRPFTNPKEYKESKKKFEADVKPMMNEWRDMQTYLDDLTEQRDELNSEIQRYCRPTPGESVADQVQREMHVAQLRQQLSDSYDKERDYPLKIKKIKEMLPDWAKGPSEEIAFRNLPKVPPYVPPSRKPIDLTAAGSDSDSSYQPSPSTSRRVRPDIDPDLRVRPATRRRVAARSNSSSNEDGSGSVHADDSPAIDWATRTSPVYVSRRSNAVRASSSSSHYRTRAHSSGGATDSHEDDSNAQQAAPEVRTRHPPQRRKILDTIEYAQSLGARLVVKNYEPGSTMRVSSLVYPPGVEERVQAWKAEQDRRYNEEMARYNEEMARAREEDRRNNEENQNDEE